MSITDFAALTMPDGIAMILTDMLKMMGKGYCPTRCFVEHLGMGRFQLKGKEHEGGTLPLGLNIRDVDGQWLRTCKHCHLVYVEQPTAEEKAQKFTITFPRLQADQMLTVVVYGGIVPVGTRLAVDEAVQGLMKGTEKQGTVEIPVHPVKNVHVSNVSVTAKATDRSASVSALSSVLDGLGPQDES